MGRYEAGSILRWSSGYLPELSAENVEINRAHEEMNRYQTRRKAEGLFRSAWCHVEFAMNDSQIFNEVRDSYFSVSQDLIQKILTDPKAHRDTQLGALILSSYIPLFRKRSLLERADNIDTRRVYESVGQAMAYIKPLDIGELPQWEMMEAAILALSARSERPDLLLYPASPREESSPHAWSNHDSYFMVDNNKIPIQQKMVHTDKEYSEWMTVLTVQPIVDKAFKRSKVNGEFASLKINYLLSLIIADALKAPIDKDETRFLNIMTSAVVSHRWSKRHTSTSSRAA